MTLSGYSLDSPYLSVVIAARNDDYGGNFLERLLTFLRLLLRFCDDFQLSTELVLTEWNPPNNKPPLKSALQPLLSGRGQRVRIIRVPETLHRALPNSDRMPMFEYLAKNVGIRRARGFYVLVTNPDIIFTPEFIQTLATKALPERSFFRADRYDFAGPLPPSEDDYKIVKMAKARVYRANVRNERGRETLDISKIRRAISAVSGRWPGTKPNVGTLDDSLHLGKLEDDVGAYHGLHTNASGDFILAPRESWLEIRGFPEFVETFTHLDSYACYQFKAVGLTQGIFVPPCMILHADHPRSEQAGRPRSSQEAWMNDLGQISSGELGPALNDENWGLGDRVLSEVAL